METRAWSVLEKLIRFVMVASSVGMTVCILASVFMRYVLKGNFYGAEDLMLMFAFWLYFIGGAYGSFEDSHIKADIVSIMVKNARIRCAIGLFAQFACIAVNLILSFWALNYMIWDLAKMPATTALHIPLIIPHSAIFFGLLLMLFYHIYYFQRNLRSYIKNGSYEQPKPNGSVEDSVNFPGREEAKEGGEA